MIDPTLREIMREALERKYKRELDGHENAVALRMGIVDIAFDVCDVIETMRATSPELRYRTLLEKFPRNE